MREQSLHLQRPDARWAFFFDIDGTLADIAAMPEEACIPRSTLNDLSSLQQKTAVALVSGRSITSIDSLTSPLKFPAAGQHGLEIRFEGDEIFHTAVDESFMAETADRIKSFQMNHPGLIVECKGLSIAVHYRMRPDLADTVQNFLDRLVRGREKFISRQHGKMVDEIRLQGGNKGTAIDAFMGTAPFRNKIPIFAGDDLTDEDAYEAVNRLGGISIQIGSSSAIAQFRMATPSDLRDWIRKIVTLEVVAA